jgi:general secretion pathway protein K
MFLGPTSRASATVVNPDDVDATSNDRGFALLLVVWVLALLAVLAASVAVDSRSEAVIARNRLEAAQARALADGGIAVAVEALIDTNPVTRSRADGQPQAVQYGNGSITLVVQDEGGKIDLNSAPIEMIAGLLDEFGIAPDERTAITAGILRRRQEFAAPSSTPEKSAMTGTTLLNRMELVTAGLPVPSPFASSRDSSATDLSKQPFADLSELRLVPGVTRAIYDQLQQCLTIYSSIPTVNPLTASREVLLAIPGVGQQDVEFWLASRDQTKTSLEKPPLTGVDRYVQATEVHAATVTATAVTSTGASFNREAVVAISPLLPLQPFRILRWR